MLRFVLAHAAKYAAIGWLAAFVASALRDGLSARGALHALGFALVWAAGGGLVAAYRWRKEKD